MSWDVRADDVASDQRVACTSFPTWMLWERCFALAPEQTHQFALGLRRFHVVDQSTGDISPSADIDGPGTQQRRVVSGGWFSHPRWAAAYEHTHDQQFLDAIVKYWDDMSDTSIRIPAKPVGTKMPGTASRIVDGYRQRRRGAPRAEPLRTRLVRCATRIDERFCALPHDLAAARFLRSSPVRPRVHTRMPSLSYGTRRGEAEHHRHRCLNVRVALREHGRVITGVCRRGGRPVRVVTPQGGRGRLAHDLGHAVNIHLAAFRYTARAEYHLRAVELAAFATEQFLATARCRGQPNMNHYESSTGGDTLALALAELHLVTPPHHSGPRTRQYARSVSGVAPYARYAAVCRRENVSEATQYWYVRKAAQ